MKREAMRKSLSILTLICLLFGCSQNVLAEGTTNDDDYIGDVIAAMSASDDTHEESSVLFTRRLYDINNNPRYIYLDYGAEGYGIYDVQSGIVIESGSVAKHIYQMENETYVYNGPFGYYSVSDEGLYDIYENRAVMEETLSDFSICLDEKIKIDSLKDPSEYEYVPEVVFPGEEVPSVPNSYNGTIYYLYNHSSYLPNYSQYTIPAFNNCCGSVAAAMYLMYYDNKVNDSYVPADQETSDGVILIGNLISLIEPSDHSGSYPYQVVNGIAVYCYLAGVNHPVHTAAFNDSTCRSQIGANHPVVARLNFGSAGHWVLLWKSIIEDGVVKFKGRDGAGDPEVKYYVGLDWMIY